MKCTVCKRELAPDWSVCPKCGAMKNDSVREELESSITPLANPVKFHFVEDRADAVPRPAVQEQAPTASAPAPVVPTPPPAMRRTLTADLGTKKTSPTLAEFKNRNAVMPDWRLQLQNSVRQRTGRGSSDEPAAAPSSATAPRQTRGANALKIQYAEDPEAESQVDLKVANALKRIEQSRRTYLPTEKAREGIRVARAAASKNFPFNVVSRSAEQTERAPSQPETVVAPVKPRLVSSLKIEKKGYDTNKLIPIPKAALIESSFHTAEDEAAEAKAPLKKNWSQKIEINGSAFEESSLNPEPPAVDETEPDTDEIDDLAPIPMRFNAGLFDLIIGTFASLIVLSPFLAWTDGWVSLTGFLLFASVLLIIMFLYLTASVAFLGHTFGMKLFSLELVDAEQSEFPTLHQAAVNSSLYLLSLVLGGLGFVPILFNEEKRAAHDLASGTILVRGI